MSQVNMDKVIEMSGTSCQVVLTKVKTLVDQYIDSNFKTNKATSGQIKESFDQLYKIYTQVLAVEQPHTEAAIRYLAMEFNDHRNGAFSPIRVNMMPNLEVGGNRASMRLVGDLNQFFGALILSTNAAELRKRIRISPILANLRAGSQRTAIENYIASIDY